MTTLKEELLSRTRRGELWRPETKPGVRAGVRCFACGHRCFLPEGRDGICKVRSNVGGELRVPWGYVGALQADPIEKKPFFHVLPGATALSFGMLGCDFHCAYCQNWFTSQALRDVSSLGQPHDISAAALVDIAVARGARVVTSTYNEPLITAEWAVDVFKQAKSRGLRTSFVSNGNATPEVLAYLRPYVDYYKVDLKCFTDRGYRQLGGVLANVQRSLQEIYRLGFWVEVVTLLIPGFNDDPAELKDLCRFLVGISPDIPWHVTAFHKDYRMQDPAETTAPMLLRAASIGRDAGLVFVYPGNLPGEVGGAENTYCPRCRTELVTRRGFRVLATRMNGPTCPDCGVAVPGRWS